MVVALLDPLPTEADHRTDLLIRIIFIADTACALDHILYQQIRCIVVEPLLSGVCAVGQAGRERAVVVGDQIFKAAGHAQLIPHADQLLFIAAQTCPSRSEIIRHRRFDVQYTFLLRNARQGGRQGLSCRSPIPSAVLIERRCAQGVGSKIFFYDDPSILKDDECPRIAGVQEVDQAGEFSNIPVQHGGIDGLPFIRIARREIHCRFWR